MNPSTIQYPSPVPAGTCTAAPTPSHSTADDTGWAMVPHTLASDVRLTAVDIRVVLALLYFARSKDTCTSCDQSLGERAGGISPGTVQRSLRRLESLGYIRRRAVPPSDANRTGRVICLLWRTGGGDCVGGNPTLDQRRATPRAQVSGGSVGAAVPVGQRCRTPRSRARDNEESGEVENRRVNVDVTDSVHSSTQTSMCADAQTAMPLVTTTPMPPVSQGDHATLIDRSPRPLSVQPSMPLAIQAPIPPAVQVDIPPVVYPPLLEELQAVGPTTSPEQVRRLAARLCTALNDPGSLGGYIAVLAKVVAGTVSKACLIAAYKAGLGAVDKVRKPGAIFQWTLHNWTPPPLPSQIRYHQQRTAPGSPVQCMAGTDQGPEVAGSALGEPTPTAETLRDLRAMAADPRHPLRHVARRRLGEIAADHEHPLQDVARRLVEGLG